MKVLNLFSLNVLSGGEGLSGNKNKAIFTTGFRPNSTFYTVKYYVYPHVMIDLTKKTYETVLIRSLLT